MPCGDFTDVLHQKIDRLEAELAAAKQENERLRNVCSEAYQILGALSTCTVTDCTKPLDNVLAAAEGDPIPHESVLPFRLNDDPLKRIAELTAELTKTRRNELSEAIDAARAEGKEQE